MCRGRTPSSISRVSVGLRRESQRSLYLLLYTESNRPVDRPSPTRVRSLCRACKSLPPNCTHVQFQTLSLNPGSLRLLYSLPFVSYRIANAIAKNFTVVSEHALNKTMRTEGSIRASPTELPNLRTLLGIAPTTSRLELYPYIKAMEYVRARSKPEHAATVEKILGVWKGALVIWREGGRVAVSVTSLHLFFADLVGPPPLYLQGLHPLICRPCIVVTGSTKHSQGMRSPPSAPSTSGSPLSPKAGPWRPRSSRPPLR